MGEVMIIARSLGHGERPDQLANFVNLNQRPENKLTAQQTAKAIKNAIRELGKPGSHAEMKIGGEQIGTVRRERVRPTEKWTTVRVKSLDLVRTAEQLAEGKLLLPQRTTHVPIPITVMGKIGRVGPVHRDIAGGPRETERGPFTKHDGANSGTEWPFLWNRDSQKQQSLEVMSDSHGTIKTEREEEAEEIWQRASNLHISNEFRFNSNATCAAFTERPSLGGRSWPNFRMRNPEVEKAACVWLNGTLGLISFWMNSNRTQSGRGTTTVRAIPDIPILDFSKLHDKQIEAASRIYDDLRKKTMLPSNEAHQDPVRHELDRRIITEVLELDDKAVDQLAILRNQWCLEPTVYGTKKTGPDEES